MKVGTFNIQDYIGKLYENVDENDLNSQLNEEDGKMPDTEGMIIPEDSKKAYDWLKKEFQKGKTEVKVEVSYHDFKPGYNLSTDVKTINNFEPGMYGKVKTGQTEGGTAAKTVAFPETKFPGSDGKAEKNESSESDGLGGESKPKGGVKVEAKTTQKPKEEVKAEEKVETTNKKDEDDK